MHDPEKVIKYGKKNNLLESVGYEWIAPFLPEEWKLQKKVKAYKASISKEPQYKFGVRVPRTVKEALKIDKENGDNQWGDALKTEVGQINSHETFRITADGIMLVGYRRNLTIPFLT